MGGDGGVIANSRKILSSIAKNTTYDDKRDSSRDVQQIQRTRARTCALTNQVSHNHSLSILPLFAFKVSSMISCYC